jgi:F420-dependent oxidoreductase-like protein
MRFALMIEPQQGMTYSDQLAFALRAEAAGFEALFRSDHYASFPGPDDRPTTDAWAVLAGLARDTSRITLGALVSPVTFRLPGNIAKLVTTVDEMSGGRLEFALGAGWNEEEHRSYGIPFPDIGERAGMLEEQHEILRGLWQEPDGWSFVGRYYTVTDARFRPKPTRRIRVIVGGEGSPRSMRIAVRYADEFNLTSADPDRTAERMAVLDAACAAAGRDPATLARSAMVGALVGADDAQVTSRSRALIALFGEPDSAESWLEERRRRWIVGTPDEARAMVRRFADAGVERIMLQDFLPWDLEMVDLLGQELLGRV